MPETADKPIELTLGDGTVVKGKDYDEALKNLAKMKEDTAAALRAAKEEAERYRVEAESYGSELQQYKNPAPREGEFNKQEYYRLLNEDPIAAQNYIDIYRFGTEDPVGAFAELRQKTDSLYQQSMTASFWASHPEFPGGRDAARAMTQRVQELTNNGHPLSLETMEMAYGQLVREETIKPVEKEQAEESPNPSLSAGAGAPPTIIDEAKIGAMTDEQFRAYARAQGLKGI